MIEPDLRYDDKGISREASAPPSIIEPAKDRRQYRLLRIAGPSLILLLWFGLTQDGLALVAPNIFPGPRGVVEAAVENADTLLQDTGATVGRVLLGLGLGCLVGILLGLLISANARIYYFFDPIIEAIRPVPAIAALPFVILWFGIAESGRIFLVAGGVFALMVVPTAEAVRNLPRIYLQAAYVLGANQREAFKYVVIPGIVPALIGPLRVASAFAFTLVVATEFSGGQSGLGLRIMLAPQVYYDPATILLGVTMLGILSGILDAIIRRTGARVTRWSGRSLPKGLQY